MRKASFATAVTVACLALAACDGGSKDGNADNEPSATQSQPSAARSSGSGTAGGGTDSPREPAALGLGEASRTVGAGTVGILEITPTTVVYVKEGTGVTSKFGTFAVVTMREKSLSANPADEERPAAGGGWQWLAPGGQRIPAGNGNAGKVVLATYDGSGAIAPGATRMRAKVFDLTPAQAKGGRVVYTDGTKSPDHWKIPAEDTGPQVADVKQRLKP
ncbi:hypothetical protein AB0F13_21025 [Streptomyces sp. NPDC026206]|uniref:hypothetical protein n=1 Tax=Streptomyces sp. NPDC026206 TaxID=3157089 RepID=UPI0033C64D9E